MLPLLIDAGGEFKSTFPFVLPVTDNLEVSTQLVFGCWNFQRCLNLAPSLAESRINVMLLGMSSADVHYNYEDRGPHAKSQRTTSTGGCIAFCIANLIKLRLRQRRHYIKISST